MRSFTIRDVFWMLLAGWIALAWQLDVRVRNLEVSEHQDTATLFRVDNALLEQQNSRNRLRIRQLEALVAPSEPAGG